jgi:hypothetical protein
MRTKAGESPALEPERLLACIAGVDQPSATAGTALHGSKVRLETWRRAAALCAAGRPRVSDLQAVCAVSYRTAWRMRQRLLDAAGALSERAPR